MKNWIIKNLSNVFGVVGIILTVYFSVFYVPSWIKASQNEKIYNSLDEVVQSIKELVFSDSTIQVSEIQTVIVSKEVEKQVVLPYSIYQILTICQNSFMEDKFLPLQNRRGLMKELETLKANLPVKEDRVDKLQKSSLPWLTILGYLASIIGVIVSIIGVISTFYNYKRKQQQEEEISNELNDANVDTNNRQYARNLERTFVDVIRGASEFEVSEPKNFDTGYDLLVKHFNGDIFIELKLLTKSNVGLGSFKRFVDFVKNSGQRGIFIYNTELTALVKKEVENLKDEGAKVKLIKVRNEDELKKQIAEALHNGNFWM